MSCQTATSHLMLLLAREAWTYWAATRASLCGDRSPQLGMPLWGMCCLQVNLVAGCGCLPRQLAAGQGVVVCFPLISSITKDTALPLKSVFAVQAGFNCIDLCSLLIACAHSQFCRSQPTRPPSCRHSYQQRSCNIPHRLQSGLGIRRHQLLAACATFRLCCIGLHCFASCWQCQAC